MKTLTYALSLSLAVVMAEQTFAQEPGIIDPVSPTAAEVYLCTFNAGKSMTDLDQAMRAWRAAADEGRFNGLTFQLTPRYGNPPLDLIWVSYIPFSEAAETAEWWDANGQEARAGIFEVVSCQTSLNTSLLRYANDVQDDDRMLVSWDWCTRLEGVTRAALRARHQEFVNRLSESNARMAYTIMFPQAGIRTDTRLGEAAHLYFYPDWAALVADHESRAQGGWRFYADYNENFASCTGENVYDAVVLNRPHTPWFQ